MAVAALSSVAHLEVQLAFKGVVAGEERWDNNGGTNWSLAVQLAQGEGLLEARPEPPPRDLVSSLLLRIEGRHNCFVGLPQIFPFDMPSKAVSPLIV